jgi:hypothetical protein
VIERYVLDERGSFAWLAGGRADALGRASAALAVDAGVLVVDPVNVPGIEQQLRSAGRVVGVASLFQRHRRDAVHLAQALGVPHLTPRALGGAGLGVPGVEERAIVRRGWREAMLWLPDRRLLFSPETLGTAPFFLAAPDERLGMHPLARLRPPSAMLAALEPDVMAFGHGAPLQEGCREALREVLHTARRRLPRHWARLVPAAVRATRASRHARREAA